jgi:hypothetical protein
MLLVRRVKDNRNGKAVSMFIIGGSNKGNFIGNNPTLPTYYNDLKHKLDFRSLYANLPPDN